METQKIDTPSPEDMLVDLAILRGKLVGLEDRRRREIKELVTPSTLELIDEVNSSADALADDYKKAAEALEASIKEDVLRRGRDAFGAGLQAAISEGRVTWDDAGLRGFAKRVPDVLSFRKAGKPFVSIRTAPKEKKG